MTELKIYSDHDERTVSQMWRCMGVGSVAGGVLCAKVLDSVHNHHNYAWRERHGERDLWVVRH